MIISIDPGVTACGVSVVSYNNSKFKVHETVNVKGTLKLRGEHQIVASKYSERTGKIHRIVTVIKEFIEKYGKVDKIILEAPFYNRTRPQAFASLLEVIFAIKYLLAFSLGLQLCVLAPMAIKKVWTDVGNCGKDLMEEHFFKKIKSKEMLIDKNNVDLAIITEHQIDSVAVGYSYFKLKELRNEELIKKDI